MDSNKKKFEVIIGKYKKSLESLRGRYNNLEELEIDCEDAFRGMNRDRRVCINLWIDSIRYTPKICKGRKISKENIEKVFTTKLDPRISKEYAVLVANSVLKGESEFHNYSLLLLEQLLKVLEFLVPPS